MFNGYLYDQRSSDYNFQQYHHHDRANFPFPIDDVLLRHTGANDTNFTQSVVRKEQMMSNMQNSSFLVPPLYSRADCPERWNGHWLNTSNHASDPGSNADQNDGCARANPTRSSLPYYTSTFLQQTAQQNSLNQQSSVDPGTCHDLVMQHLVQEVKAISIRLNIPQDPCHWSAGDCRVWLTDLAAQCGLMQLSYENFNTDGATLCRMSIAELEQHFPNCGQAVQSQLQVWTAANEYCKRWTGSCVRPKEMLPVANHITPSHHLHQHQYNTLSTNQSIKPFQNQPPHLWSSHPSTNGVGVNLHSSQDCSGWTSQTQATEGVASTPVHNSSPVSLTFSTRSIHLWQFLHELLNQVDKYRDCVRWIDKSSGIFKITDSHKLASLWGQRKNRPTMNYDKLSRSLRQYYKKKILKKTTRSERLVYQFLHPFHLL